RGHLRLRYLENPTSATLRVFRVTSCSKYAGSTCSGSSHVRLKL
ncbi:hypothetical protein JMJ77_0011361, partial [Colletotrichum scovillei]